MDKAMIGETEMDINGVCSYAHSSWGVKQSLIRIKKRGPKRGPFKDRFIKMQKIECSLEDLNLRLPPCEGGTLPLS